MSGTGAATTGDWPRRVVVILPEPEGDRIATLDGALPEGRLTVKPGLLWALAGVDAVATATGWALRPVREVAVADDVYVVQAEWAAPPPPDVEWRATATGFEEVVARWREAERGDGPDRMAWTRPGWFDATLAWIDEALGAIGVERTGVPVAMRHWSIAAILDIPTTQGSLVLKHSLPIWRREGPLVRLLAEGAPGMVPEAVVVDPAVSRWIARRFPGQPYAGEYDLGRLAPVTALADIQAAASARSEEAVATGLADLSLPAVLSRITELPEAGVDGHMTDLEAAAERLTALDMAPSVIHGDFHHWNTLADDAPPFVFDWTDAGWGPPLLDLAVWCQRVDVQLHEPVIRTWGAAYGVDPDEMWRAWPDALALGYVRYAGCFADIFDVIGDRGRAVWGDAIAEYGTKAKAALALHR